MANECEVPGLASLTLILSVVTAEQLPCLVFVNVVRFSDYGMVIVHRWQEFRSWKTGHSHLIL